MNNSQLNAATLAIYVYAKMPYLILLITDFAFYIGKLGLKNTESMLLVPLSVK